MSHSDLALLDADSDTRARAVRRVEQDIKKFDAIEKALVKAEELFGKLGYALYPYSIDYEKARVVRSLSEVLGHVPVSYTHLRAHET